MSKELRSCSLRNKKWREDVNPLENLANLADAILVFACGLMLALIVSGGIHIDLEQVNLKQGEELTEVDETSETLKETMNAENGYEKMGVLYREPETGKMYMLSQ